MIIRNALRLGLSSPRVLTVLFPSLRLHSIINARALFYAILALQSPHELLVNRHESKHAKLVYKDSVAGGFAHFTMHVPPNRDRNGFTEHMPVKPAARR